MANAYTGRLDYINFSAFLFQLLRPGEELDPVRPGGTELTKEKRATWSAVRYWEGHLSLECHSKHIAV